MSIIRTKPIPIPRETTVDPHSNDEMIGRDAEEIYDFVTWRMFERIMSARLRAGSNIYCKVVVGPPSVLSMTQGDHNVAATTTTSSQQQLDVTRRDRVYSLPEPPSVPQPQPPLSSLMDEVVFPMDSL